jgi:hypothetical protein
MSKFGKKIIEGLERLLRDLQSDESLEVTEVRRVDTPDGPMHIRRKVIYHERGINRGTEDEAPEVFP